MPSTLALALMKVFFLLHNIHIVVQLVKLSLKKEMTNEQQQKNVQRIVGNDTEKNIYKIM